MSIKFLKLFHTSEVVGINICVYIHIILLDPLQGRSNSGSGMHASIMESINSGIHGSSTLGLCRFFSMFIKPLESFFDCSAQCPSFFNCRHDSADAPKN
jgi:hypothetical protein